MLEDGSLPLREIFGNWLRLGVKIGQLNLHPALRTDVVL